MTDLGYTINGELDSHGRIVLIAGGADVDIDDAGNRLSLLTPLLKPTEPTGGVWLPCTWPAVVQLAGQFGAAWRPGPRLRDWITGQVQRRDASPAPLEVSIPAGLTPYPWQESAARLIAATGHALITDEPGTGKSLSAILGLCQRAEAGVPVLPVLVVCPASVVDPWVEAWRTWVPNLSVVAWRGRAKPRHQLGGTAQVYVSSYDTARVDAGPNNAKAPLIMLGPTSLVIDECHLIKSPTAVRSLAVRRLARRASNVIALSGTPITHHPGDLWPTLVALDPDAWPSRERWIDRYCQTIAGDYKDEIVGLDPAREPEFRLTLHGQHRRVAKADCLDLPPKVYSVRTVELPTAYRRAYDDMEEMMLAALPDGGEISAMHTFALLTRLAQLASAAAEVSVTTTVDETGTEHEHQHVSLTAPSWKVDALLEVLDERPGSPVVAFAPSRQLIVLAGHAAEAAGLNVGYIYGKQKMSDRTETIERFQDGKLDLCCATTGAGGVGLTLTAARTVVFLQRPWSLVEAIQAEDRCHRIGSERHESIEIIDIVARDTIDSRVRQVLKSKGRQLADLVQDPRILSELLGGTKSTKHRKAS
jgi:SNF2 family DNA or RNA helicase